MAHPVVHFEIGGPDASALQQYYTELFGWSIDANNPMNYGMVSAIEPGIGGGVGPTPDGSPHVTFYVETDDLQATLDKVEKLGGKTVMPPMDVPDGPAIAQFADPQGNVIGLVKGM
jgi:predicted enzyme related to lactoylglutathione lyase